MFDLISVIIPTYNRAYCLFRSIDSVLKQTYSNIEVLIIDDCSTDNTKEIVNHIHDDRLRYYGLEVNAGPAKARNIGIKKARGAYIAFQDSDDYWYPEKLEEEMKVLHKRNCGLVFCQFLCKGDYEMIIPGNQEFDVSVTEHGFLDYLLESNKIGTPTILTKRALLETIGGFDDSLKVYEDWDLVIRMSLITKIGYINRVLMEVYPSTDGINVRRGKERAEAEMKFIKTYWNMFLNKTVFCLLLEYLYDDLEEMSFPDRKFIITELNSIISPEDYLLLNKQLFAQIRDKNQVIEEQHNAILYLEGKIRCVE